MSVSQHNLSLRGKTHIFLKHCPVSGSPHGAENIVNAHAHLWKDAPPVTGRCSSSHSENYLVRWGSKGFPKEIEMLNNLKVVFTVSVHSRCALMRAMTWPWEGGWLGTDKDAAWAPCGAVFWALYRNPLLMEASCVLGMLLAGNTDHLLCSCPHLVSFSLLYTQTTQCYVGKYSSLNNKGQVTHV